VPADSDPRVYFAAERTLLAWIRTGLAVMGLGFVVARFGLFLRMIRHAPEASPHLGSTVIGVALVLLGSTAIAMGARQHIRFVHTLQQHDRPTPNLSTWSVAFAFLLALIGAALAIYLLLRAEAGPA
jgi:putative membrane protein